MLTRLSYLPLAGLALWGCRSQAPADASSQAQPQKPVTRPALGGARSAGFAIRLPAKGGPAKIYRLPALTEIPNGLRARVPPVQRVVGLDPESAFLFLLTAKKELMACDLESGRLDTVATAVEQATLGPDGTLYAVDDKRRVVSLARRVRFAWPQPLAAVPTELFGATDQRLVAVIRRDPARLVTAAPDQPPSSRELALGGDIAATLWGDLLAVASDSGVTLVDPLGRREPAFVSIADHPRALAFSPAGHLVYVARRTGLGLAVIDRFELREIDGVGLPGPAATIRLDPSGRWLLARPALGDSVWVVDLPVKALLGGIATSWHADLPTISPDGTLLVEQGGDVVALRADSIRETGRVRGGGDDLWVATMWRTRRAGSASEAAVVAVGADAGGEGPLYVQVSVSQNQTWSTEMAQQLSRAGLAASVLPPPPGRPDDGFRVVLGPYPTRANAEAIGRKLGRPYWIYQPEP